MPSQDSVPGAPSELKSFYKGVFISYSHADRNFASDLKRQLEKCRVSVWMDNSQLNAEDKLTPAIKSAISDRECMVVLVSSNSLKSSWVKKELEYGIELERSGGTLKIIPVKLDCSGTFAELSDRMHVEMTSHDQVQLNVDQILLSIVRYYLPVNEDDILVAAKSLEHSFDEIRSLYERAWTRGGIDKSLFQNCLNAAIPKPHLAAALEVLSLIPQPHIKFGVHYGCAYSLGRLVQLHQIGLEELERILARGIFTGSEMESLADPFTGRQSSHQILDTVKLFKRYFKCDARFNSFIQNNISKIGDNMAQICDYLVSVDRGPSNYNIDSFVSILQKHPEADILKNRIIYWIHNGNFEDPVAALTGVVFFRCLQENWGRAKSVQDEITTETIERIKLLTKQNDEENQARAFILIYNAIASIDGADWPTMKRLAVDLTSCFISKRDEYVDIDLANIALEAKICAHRPEICQECLTAPRIREDYAKACEVVRNRQKIVD